MERKAYPSDVTYDEWAFVAPYLTLISEEAPQRDHSLREVFNGLHWKGYRGWKFTSQLRVEQWHHRYPSAQWLYEPGSHTRLA